MNEEYPRVDTLIESKTWRRPFSVASAAFALLLLSACSSDPVDREDQQSTAFADLRTVVEESVSDEARRGDVLAIVESLDGDVESLRELLVQRRAEPLPAVVEITGT